MQWQAANVLFVYFFVALGIISLLPMLLLPLEVAKRVTNSGRVIRVVWRSMRVMRVKVFATSLFLGVVSGYVTHTVWPDLLALANVASYPVDAAILPSMFVLVSITGISYLLIRRTVKKRALAGQGNPKNRFCQTISVFLVLYFVLIWDGLVQAFGIPGGDLLYIGTVLGIILLSNWFRMVIRNRFFIYLPK